MEFLSEFFLVHVPALLQISKIKNHMMWWIIKGESAHSVLDFFQDGSASDSSGFSSGRSQQKNGWKVSRLQSWD